MNPRISLLNLTLGLGCCLLVGTAAAQQGQATPPPQQEAASLATEAEPTQAAPESEPGLETQAEPAQAAPESEPAQAAPESEPEHETYIVDVYEPPLRSATPQERAASADAAVATAATEPSASGTGPQAAARERLQLVDWEIQQIDEEMPGIAWPVALTFGGFGVASLMLFAQVVVSSDCYGPCDVQPAPFIIAGAGAAVGIAGAVWWGIQSRKRQPYQRKIELLEKERGKLTLDIQARARGAYTTLELVF